MHFKNMNKTQTHSSSMNSEDLCAQTATAQSGPMGERPAPQLDSPVSKH